MPSLDVKSVTVGIVMIIYSLAAMSLQKCTHKNVADIIILQDHVTSMPLFEAESLIGGRPIGLDAGCTAMTSSQARIRSVSI